MFDRYSAESPAPTATTHLFAFLVIVVPPCIDATKKKGTNTEFVPSIG